AHIVHDCSQGHSDGLGPERGDFAWPRPSSPTARGYARPRACASVSGVLGRVPGWRVMTRIELAAFLLTVCIAADAAAQPDIVLLNGKIVTVDGRSSVQQALAIRDGKIAALGGNAQIRKLAGSTTRVIDLG